MKERTSLVGVVLLLGITLFAGQATAAENAKAAARKQFKAGVALLEVEDFAAAAERFADSVKIYPTKNGLFNLANCYLALGRYEEALEAIEALKTQFGSEIDMQWKDEISNFEQKMENEVVKLEIQVNVDGADVLINGERIGSTPIDEPIIIRRGEHVIEVTQDGYKPEQRSVSLVDEKEATVRLTLARESDPAPAEGDETEAETEVTESTSGGAGPKRIGAWVSFGVAGVTAVAAIITGSKQYALVSEIEEDCTNKVCNESLREDRDKAHALGVTTNILAGVAIAGVATGTLLLILDNKERKNAQGVAVSPAVLPGGGGLVVTGRF